MSVRTDQVNLNINVNGSKAQNELNELRKRAADLTFEMKTNLVKGTKEYIAASADLKKVNADMKVLKKTIGLTALSMKELNASKRQLTSLRDSVGPETAEWKKYNDQLRLVIARQNEVRTSTKGVGTAFSSVKQSIAGLALGFIGFQALVGGIRSLITSSIKLSDQLGDLRRVSGLTKVEANELNKSLLQIDSRTSGEGLRNIAIIAGKLGVAKIDILSFTEAVDKLVVTLGDELGDADQITTQLGKILNVFEGEVTGETISNLGNAFVELANAGVATGGFIADFTQRVAGIAKASNMSLGSTVGLAAGFEELGLRSESSSTALQTLVSRIAGDIPKAAKIAGIPMAEFNQLFAKKPQEALIKYAEGLIKNKSSFSEITASFKDAGQEGVRVVQTLQAIGQQGDFLREKIDLGNESIERQTALNEGFALKNENLAGSIEKLGKVFDKLVANERVTGFLIGLVNSFSNVITGVESAINAFKTFDQYIADDQARKEKNRKDIAESISENLGSKSLEEQKKLAESYRAIYIASQKALSNFLKSGNKDIKERNRLLEQQLADEKIYLATQERVNQTILKNKKGDDKEGTGVTGGGTPLAGTNKDAGKAKAEFDRLKKEAEKFYEDLQKLKRDAETASLSGDDKELLALQDKYDALHKKALEYFKKNVTSRAQYTDQENLIVESFNKELEDLQKKQFGKYSEEEYAKSLEATKDYFDAERLQAGKNYADLLLTKEDYDAELLRLDMQEKKQLVVVAEGYVGTVKKAEGDLLKFKIDASKFATENDIKEVEKRVDFARKEVLAKAKLAVLAAPEGSNTRQNAERDLAEAQWRQEVMDKQLEVGTEAYKLKWEEFQQELVKIDQDYAMRRIEAIEAWADQFMNITANLFQVLDNMDTRRFNKEKALNDAKKNNYKQQLDGKLMSQKQYDAKVAAADEELDRKKKELELKAFKRKQALGIADALINGSVAVAKTFAQFGWPLGIPFAAAMAVITGLQVAAIATQEPPQMGQGGLISNGPYHKNKSKGLPVINPETGKTELLLEKDEGVVKGKAMRDKEKYTVSGTPSQIASKLNAMHGGVNWESGAVIQMNNRPRPQLNPDLPRIMEQGGIIRPLDAERDQRSSGETDDLLRKLIAKQDDLIDEVKNQKERLHAVVSIKEFRSTEKKYDNAKKASGMDQ